MLNKYHFNSAFFCVCILITGLFILSCSELVQVNPPETEISSATVFDSDATAMAALQGIYSSMMSNTGFASGSLSSVTRICGIASDELIEYSGIPDYESIYENTISPRNSVLYGGIWSEAFKYIYYSNLILEGIDRSEKISEKYRLQIEGECKFIRAFCYFYLVNLYGEVPLILSTDYQDNNISSRQTSDVVYAQIVNDLNEAILLMDTEYMSQSNDSDINRVRPNKYAAISLLARVSLFLGRWADAEVLSSEVISRSDKYGLVNIDDVFLKNSMEAIWQLMPVAPSLNTYEGNMFILTAVPSSVSLSPTILEVFDSGDSRLGRWIGSYSESETTFYYPYKYKIVLGTPIEEYSMVIRLAEIYLIRAEARVRQGLLDSAASDLDQIRIRAGLPVVSEVFDNVSADILLNEIVLERKREFFAEWGHRWLDLKRYDIASAVLGPIKDGWESTDELFPIPQREIDNNPNLKPQNEGY